MSITITRPSPGWLIIDVGSDDADKARVYDTQSRILFALKVSDACTLDVWRVLHIKPKRGITNMGFVAALVLDNGMSDYYASEQDDVPCDDCGLIGSHNMEVEH